MWQTVLNLIKLAFTFAEKMQKMESTIKELSQSNRDLTAQLQRLQFEFILFKERDAHEREKEKLQLENRQLLERLEQQRELPPASNDKKTDGE